VPLEYSTDLGRLDRLKNDLAFRIRRKVFDVFMREFGPDADMRVADFGVTGKRNHRVHHFFEALYPHREGLTAIGRAEEGAGWLTDAFPGLTYLEADLRKIPVPDDYFDAGLCNAVVEHAGSRQQQAALIAEVCRVSRNVMFTTPNRWFPVELHTFLPLLHWFPERLYRRLLKTLGFRYFAEVSNLNLLDASSLMALFPANRSNRVLRLGLPMLRTNIVCISRKGSSGRR
jgi:SAM-dependent methyltransferase